MKGVLSFRSRGQTSTFKCYTGLVAFTSFWLLGTFVWEGVQGLEPHPYIPICSVCWGVVAMVEEFIGFNCEFVVWKAGRRYVLGRGKEVYMKRFGPEESGGKPPIRGIISGLELDLSAARECFGEGFDELTGQRVGFEMVATLEIVGSEDYVDARVLDAKTLKPLPWSEGVVPTVAFTASRMEQVE